MFTWLVGLSAVVAGCGGGSQSEPICLCHYDAGPLTLAVVDATNGEGIPSPTFSSASSSPDTVEARCSVDAAGVCPSWVLIDGGLDPKDPSTWSETITVGAPGFASKQVAVTLTTYTYACGCIDFNELDETVELTPQS